MNFLKKVLKRSETVWELSNFLWKRKLWWLLPIVIALLILGVLLIFLQATATVAPFVYTLF